MFERRYAFHFGRHFRYYIYVKFLGGVHILDCHHPGNRLMAAAIFVHRASGATLLTFQAMCFTRCFREVATGQLELGGLSLFWGPVTFKRPLVFNIFGCKHFLVVEMEGRTSVVETKQSFTEFQNRNNECREKLASLGRFQNGSKILGDTPLSRLTYLNGWVVLQIMCVHVFRRLNTFLVKLTSFEFAGHLSFQDKNTSNHIPLVSNHQTSGIDC